MDKPLDSWGKLLWEQRGLEALRAQREVELAAERLALDLRLDPMGALTEEARLILGAAACMAASTACIELYSTRPKKTALLRSLRKYLVVREAEPDAALWIVFSERSAALLRYLNAVPLREAPEGFYDLGSQGTQRLVVVPELPATPETLFLRLLGRGTVLRDALHEALSLHADHPLGRSVTSRLGPFRGTFTNLGLLPQLHSEEDTVSISEFFTPEIIAAYDARMERERQAHQQQGELLVLGRLCRRTLGRPLTDEESAGLAQRLHAEGLDATMDAVTERSPDDLLAWLGGSGA